MPNAVIVDAVRTPVGRRNGRLSGWHPVDLAAQPLRALVERNDLDPVPHRGRDHGLHHDGGRAGHEHRSQRRPGRRLPRIGARDHRRPAVRVGPAGRPLRRPGRDVGGHGHRHRGRDRVDDPGPHRLDHRPGAGRGLRTDRPRPLPVHPPGPLGRRDRRALGDQPAPDGRLRPRVPPPGRRWPRTKAASATRSSRWRRRPKPTRTPSSTSTKGSGGARPSRNWPPSSPPSPRRGGSPPPRRRRSPTGPPPC